MAYEGAGKITGAKPSCAILSNLKTLGAVGDLLSGKTMTVTHPVSAPPPEVL